MNKHSEDYLKREEFLIFLENVVKYSIKYHNENTESKAIGIDGEWGSGKTWILEEFAKRNSGEYLIFYYNAWNNDYYDEPLVGILASMIETINSSKDIELLKIRYKDAFKQEMIDKLKQIAEDIISSIEIKGVPLGKIFRIFKRLNDKSKIGFKDNLKYINVAINQISRVLDKIPIPIIIMVDELDRCLPEYAIKVLERLHHIDNATKIIQIIALNKKNIAYGIAKVYGRFDLLNKQGENGNEILDFASSYFKKFFNIFLPLNNGLIEGEKSDLLFDGKFLSQVKGYKFDSLLTQGIKINIDKDYFLKFYSKLVGGVNSSGINIREQMKIIDLVQICHSITKESALLGNYYLDNFEYQHLIWEIIVCVNLLITRKSPINQWFTVHRLENINATPNFHFSIGYVETLHSNDNFINAIADNLTKIFPNSYSNNPNKTLNTLTSKDELQIHGNESFILAYYKCISWTLEYYMSIGVTQYNKLVNKIIKEQKFLQEFQKNMKMLIN